MQTNFYEYLKMKKPANTQEHRNSLWVSIQISNIIPFRNAEHNSAAGLDVVRLLLYEICFPFLPTEPSGYALYLITYIHS